MNAANETTATDYAPPANELERELVAMWSEVLGVAPAHVGVETFFMDLGGSSLLLKQVLVRVNDQYETNLLIPDLFKYPTIRELADRLANKPATTPSTAAPAQGDRRRAALLARRQQANR